MFRGRFRVFQIMSLKVKHRSDVPQIDTEYRYFIGAIKDFPTKQTILSTTLSLDSSDGVELHVSVQRGRQKFIFPILMSSEIQPAATAYGLVLPVLAYAAVKALFIVPYLRQQREGAVEEKREEEKERLAARRLAALDEIQLMSNSVQTIIEQEETLFMQYINATIEYESFLTLGVNKKIIFK